MYQVFNMGHRFELYVPEEVVDDLIEISESFNVQAQVVGHVEAAPTKRAAYTNGYGLLRIPLADQ